MRVAIVINTAWNIYNFRMGLMKSLREEGYEVIAVAPMDEYATQIEKEGFQFVEVKMENTGSNPIKDLGLIFNLYRVYRKIKPDIVLQYTIKPNTYGSIAAFLARIPAINNVSGLGTVFLKKGWVSTVAMWIYRFSFRFPKLVFFQNEHDQELFIRKSLVRQKLTRVIPGSGIDLDYFKPRGKKEGDQPFTFLVISRLLLDKGLVEFAEAVKILNSKGVKARYQLMGALDTRHRRGIPQEMFEEWKDTNLIDYLGTTDDVRDYIAESDCVVLPSYREGTPRTLLEAASMGKPLLATDVPGCNNVVIHEYNGFLCKVRDSKDLSEKMERMADTDQGQLEEMGLKSRELAEGKFDQRIVFDNYLKYIRNFTNQQETNGIH